jgi:hypothetical protein
MSGRSSEYQIGYGRPPQQTRFRKGQSGNPKGRPKGSRALASIWLRAMNEKVTINENGQRRRITKQEAAVKQLANKAASGDKRAIQDMLRFQTMLFPDAPMRGLEPANSKHPPPDADPAKVALAILHVLREANATRESESAG